PHAKIQPTTFPVLFVKSISKIKLLGLFLTVFTGDHVRFKEVEIIEAASIKIISQNNDDIIYQVDGETSTCQSCEISKQTKPIWINGSMNETYVKEEVN